MNSEPLPVLFTHFGDQWLRGSETLLLDLLKHIDPRRIRPIVWCNGVAMADAAREAGFPTYRTDFEYFFDSGSLPFSWRRYRALVREGLALVRKHGIRVLHANAAAPSQWLVPVARSAGVPLLVHLHIDYLRRSRFVFLLHQASLVVGVSQQAVAALLEDGMAPRKVGVIYNGIDFARIAQSTTANPRRELGIADDAVVISTVGSLIPRKGQDVLIRAFASLPRERDVHILVVSDGPERDNLERLTAELDLAGRVHFLGFYDDVGAVYRASDIVALASRADAFGLVLAEAGYFALPAVATTVGGIPEVITHGATGLLVPPDDPPALAAALARLIDDPAYRRQLGAAAKQRVEAMFSVDHMVARFHEAYEGLAMLPSRDLGWGGGVRSLAPYLQIVGNRTLRRQGPGSQRLDRQDHVL